MLVKQVNLKEFLVLLWFFLKIILQVNCWQNFKGLLFRNFPNSCFYSKELIKSDFLWMLISSKISRESFPKSVWQLS